MVYRVLLTDPLGPEGLEQLRQHRELDVVARTDLGPRELPEAMRGFHALIVRSRTKVTADSLAAADALRVIGRAGIGVDNIDVAAATKRGVVVMNTPGGSNVTTAEHAIAMLLSLARNIPQANAAVKTGTWPRERWIGTEVCNKTLGVVGLGNIGTIVAERALGLRMKVIAFDPFVTAEVAARLRVELVRQLKRRRTQVAFGLLIVVPIIIAVAFEVGGGAGSDAPQLVAPAGDHRLIGESRSRFNGS